MILNRNDESRCICQDFSEKQTEPVVYVVGSEEGVGEGHADMHMRTHICFRN